MGGLRLFLEPFGGCFLALFWLRFWLGFGLFFMLFRGSFKAGLGIVFTSFLELKWVALEVVFGTISQQGLVAFFVAAFLATLRTFYSQLSWLFDTVHGGYFAGDFSYVWDCFQLVL